MRSRPFGLSSGLLSVLYNSDSGTVVLCLKALVVLLLETEFELFGLTVWTVYIELRSLSKPLLLTNYRPADYYLSNSSVRPFLFPGLT